MEWGCIGFLGVCGVFDYKSKEIPLWIFWLFGLLAMLVSFFQGDLFTWSMAVALLPGVILFLLGKCTGKIGEGDGLMVLVLGMYTDGLVCIRVLFGGLLLTAVTAVGLLLNKKGTFGTELPFAPFLFISCVVYKAVEILSA